MYINKLYEIVKKYSNTYHKTMKMKPAAVKLGMYIECGFENNYNNSKFNVNDRVRIPKYEKKNHKELHFKSV